MKNNDLSSRALDTIYKTSAALFEYIVEFRNTKDDNEVIKEAYSHIVKASEVLDNITLNNMSVIYGPPETVFSPKELAEMKFRDETEQLVNRTELKAEQWREIVGELVSTEECDCKIIQDLINEKTTKV